jgi:hypothetical protein
MSLALAFVVAFVALAVRDLVKDELRGQIERVPHRLLWLARLRLPAELRVRFYDAEWRPELEHILTRLESTPLTRLAVGTGYAFGLLWAASRIACEYGAPAHHRMPVPLLLGVAGLAALLSLTSGLGIFGAYLGAALSLLCGLVVVVVVFAVLETIAVDLRDTGRRKPWA